MNKLTGSNINNPIDCYINNSGRLDVSKEDYDDHMDVSFTLSDKKKNHSR